MKSANARILTLNGGSSTIKFALFEAGDSLRRILEKNWIGSFAAALGGLDTLVFAGGIGENAPLTRERICDGLGFLGIELNPQRNAKNAPLISPDAARVKVRVIRTDEELMIARSVSRVLNLGLVRET